MPGLLAVSWSEHESQRACQLFEQARDAYTRLKGLACNSEVTEAGFRIARFAGDRSPYPAILRTHERDLVIAAAGWWFDRDAPEHIPPSVDQLGKRFLRERERVFDQLQGQYLVVTVDLRERRLIAAGDQLGIFPVYVAEGAGLAWISTSSGALAAALRPRLDTEALRALFVDGAICSPRSAFERIRRLEFGERTTLAAGRATVSREWLPFRKTRSYRSVKDAADEGISLVRRSCRRIRQVWPRGLFDLTSGFDTRLVVGAAIAENVPMSVTVSGPATHIDVTIANRIAQRFGWPIRHFDAPEDWGQQRWGFFKQGVALVDGELPGDMVDGTIWSKLQIRELFDSAVGGGCGEFLRNSLWAQEPLRIGRTSAVDVSRCLQHRFFSGASRPEMSIFRRDWQADYVADQTSRAQQIADLAPEALNTAKLDAIYIWKGNFSRWAGMIFPLVAAPLPLATAELNEFSIGVPWTFRLDNRLMRHMIARVAPQLAAMPTCYGGSAEPMSITRPLGYLSRAVPATIRLVRKVGQLTFKHPVFLPPPIRSTGPMFDRGLVSVLDAEGLLNIENMRTACLYNMDGLRQFLTQARDEGFRSFRQLYAIFSIEVLSQLCGITPSDEEF